MSTKARTIGYWVATAIIALIMLLGGVTSLMQQKEGQEGMAHLGYPAYFSLILGSWKVLGTIALLAPGFPRLKEWAYAGFVFDLTGAAASQAFVKDPISHVMGPLVFLLVLIASWALRPESRRLPGPPV